MTFVLTLLVIQITIVCVESYNLECPSEANWKIRANLKCNSTLKYFCLYNNIQMTYVEGCAGPDWDRKGSKRIFSVSFTRGECMQMRYQPLKFWTNKSMSDCIFAKSLCSEAGQIVHNDDSPKHDTTCRCDHKKNYSFTKTPRHICYCIPTEEDCSCYIKSCPVNSTLTTDYVCLSNSYKENPKCMDRIRYSKTSGEKTQENMEENNLWLDNISSGPRWKDTPAASILFCLCFTYILVTGSFVFVSMFHECAMGSLQHVMHTGFSIVQQWLRENLQSLKRYRWIGQTGANHTEIERTLKALTAEEIGKESGESVTLESTNEAIETDVPNSEPVTTADCHFIVTSESTIIDNTHDKVTAEEINFIRMVHLLFRVACPVVQLTFNHEIQPEHLQRTLNKHKAKMKEQYKKNENVFNNCQWDLLYKNTKERPVKSDKFDISLMLFVLHTMTNIKVGDFYPVQSDTSIGAMLSKIKYIRNETTQSVDGLLSQERFNQYWDAVGQAVLHLVTQYGLNIEENEEHQRLLGRLLTLNPIDLDENKVCRYICMSEKYPATIIQKIISEYCTLKKQMIEDILRDEKHELYHKRIKTYACCVCDQEDISFSTYAKIISERQWEAMYEMKKESDFHSCPSNLKKCSESFIPKKIDTCDLSVTLTFVLNTPDILKHIINRLCKNGFNNFLMDNKHTIYHAMENRRCCECCKTPTEKIIITKREWDILFRKENDTLCRSGNTNCCCQYSVRSGINNLIMDDTFLCKIVHVAGPLSVLYKKAQDSFLYYLNWTDGKQDLKGALTELLNLIEDDTFHRDMLQNISSIDYSQTDKTIANSVEAHGWVSKHLRNQKASTDRPLQIIVFDKVILVAFSVPARSYMCDLKTDSGEIKSVCCADYEAEENECIACSKGYTSDIGQRCRSCPANTYGERCRRECSCVGYEICDNVEGCVEFQSTTSTSLDKTADITSVPRDIDATANGKNTDSSVQGLLAREIVVYLTLSVLVLIFGICACFIFHKNMKKKTTQNMSHPLRSHNIGMDQRVYDFIDETNMLNDHQLQQMQTWQMSPAYLDVISDSNNSVCVESKDLDNQDSACHSLSNTQTKSQDINLKVDGQSLISGDSTSSSDEYPKETPQDYLNPYQPMIEMKPPKIREYLKLATVQDQTDRNFVNYKKGPLSKNVRKPQYPQEVEKDILPMPSESS